MKEMRQLRKWDPAEGQRVLLKKEGRPDGAEY